MSLVARAHELGVHRRRIRVLAGHLASLIPNGFHVLDVGSGDGRLASRVLELRPDLTLTGIDVMVRPDAAIPVQAFDGTMIPLADQSVDVVTFVDVLHHTVSPVVLLREAARVARHGVVMKDHLVEGWLARATLRMMDWVGNAPHGVVLPYNYLTRAEWQSMFVATGLTIEAWRERLALYPEPATRLFDRSLHFVARLAPRRPGHA